MVRTIGHGARSAEELVDVLRAAGVATLVDVRRWPGSRRHPQFGGEALRVSLGAAGVDYLHLPALGGRLSDEPGEERFACIRVAAFRSYVARMALDEWQKALDEALARPAPCVLCAETAWQRCHRRLIAEQLAARGHEVVHLIRPGEEQPHVRWNVAEYRDGRLFVCDQLVA